MKSDKEVNNFVVGYIIGQKIRKALETSLGMVLIVCIWFVPLWIFDFLGIGHS